jgi:predicted RNA polymerase sigma factor
VLSGVAISQIYTARLNQAPEAEMAYRKALSMSQQERERPLFDPGLVELQKQ